ncbi:hypothetical protein H9Q69_009232 [Fusarium xylarioides]|uniref:Uncharacterized protein n=1 Tax=Fusarium xylarioides TaxID=221167 RepID=A0A9P7HVG0_9HYPO|nr:hypothetical protein H9Q70_006847 [Fusarium xylarioides]KAG5766841.1 hypothetical protein H9Q72_005112 [Fusarium xylarioides]KAG5779697.1 hypothetical protein H9Q73_006635 [Fusarium xylarioides]KAG5791724.1 hypothetical protein H9Q69_009232 [Fusarium xylarioides]
MADPGFLMPDLIEKASKLNIDDLDTNKSVSSISRYQEYPYARFYSGPFRKCDGPEKISPEYHERVRKALRALEEKYLEAYQVYQTWKNELIVEIEKDDQHSWNNFILDPHDRMEFGEGILKDLETFLPFSNTFYPFPSYKSQDAFNKKLFKRRAQLAEIKGLIETGRRELARLEGSDAFIQLRNDFVKYHEEVAANCDLCDIRDETSSCSSSNSGGTSRTIED